jgi:hypothetical protein
MTQAQQTDEAQTRVIRVLLLEITGIVADLVRRIVIQHDDVEIVGAFPDATDLRSLGEITGVDLVITEYQDDRSSLRRLDPILAARPGLRALAIEGDGRSASVYALVPQLTQLGPLSAGRLMELIRTSASRSPAWDA